MKWLILISIFLYGCGDDPTREEIAKALHERDVAHAAEFFEIDQLKQRVDALEGKKEIKPEVKTAHETGL